MDAVLDVGGVVVDTLNDLPLWALPLLSLLVSPPALLLHELGHAGAALVATRGRVEVTVGGEESPFWLVVGRLRVVLGLVPFAGGRCTYEPHTLRRGRDEALIAAAGPVASLLAAIVLLALATGRNASHELLSEALIVAALVNGLGALLSAIPMRFALGSGGGGGESDGLVRGASSPEAPAAFRSRPTAWSLPPTVPSARSPPSSS